MLQSARIFKPTPAGHLCFVLLNPLRKHAEANPFEIIFLEQISKPAGRVGESKSLILDGEQVLNYTRTATRELLNCEQIFALSRLTSCRCDLITQTFSRATRARWASGTRPLATRATTAVSRRNSPTGRTAPAASALSPTAACSRRTVHPVFMPTSSSTAARSLCWGTGRTASFTRRPFHVSRSILSGIDQLNLSYS